ncbi:MAG: hypothetical protein CMJ74_01885 [Planctomycetaceae bacterium]|nr:hypothetical protein [Planctomycetaceae bacterium]|tara:strand:+ start:36375 stop:37319 length:945 start_codon:yes stop_codon:yes gene_type:complete
MPHANNQKRSTIPPRSHRGDKQSHPSGPERLQKVLAAAGIASRRQCERLILEGRVEVDQRVVTKLGTKVDLDTESVHVDGVPLVRSQTVYYMINKPKGVVCTHRDPSGRTRIIDLVPDETARMFSVGRLDRESEGLILLTNDGGLAQQLAHPRYGIEKTYHVQVAGLTDREVLRRLREGVQLAEGKVAVAAVRMKRTYKQSTILEIKLREGKNREIRRMLASLGHKVQRLKRVGLGPLTLGKLPQGESRVLQHSELVAIQNMVAGGVQSKSARRGKPGKKDGKSAVGKKSSKFGKQSPHNKKKAKTRPSRSKKS